MLLINCEINVVLTWSVNCFIIDASVDNQVSTFVVTDTKRYVPPVMLSTQDNAKLLQQSKLGLKRTINLTKYQSKVTVQERSPYLDYLIEPSIQRVNRNFVSSFENTNDRISYRRYFLPQVETKSYNVMIDG